MASPTLLRVPARGSSVVTLSSLAGVKPTIATKVVTGLKRVFFTAASLQDPSQLFQVIQQIHDQLVNALQSIRSSPILTGTLLQNVTFTGGQTQVLSHYLGRPYVGWLVARAQTGAQSFTEATLPAGATADKVIALTSGSAGTYSIWIF